MNETTIEDQLAEVPIADFYLTAFALEVGTGRREMLTISEAYAAVITVVNHGRGCQVRVGCSLEFH